ncbi:MAG: class I SAM-dependent methyltransferase [Pseudohongiellaceae bacterium]
MTNPAIPGIRKYLRKMPLAYQALGLFKRMAFETQLFRQNLKFRKSDGMAGDGRPLPPPRLRYRVHGQIHENTFLEGGKNIASDIKTILAEHHRPIDQCHSYLDFGCGCSRVLRYFFSAGSSVRFSGTDIDPEAIEWNRRHFKHDANWAVNSPDPPADYPDDQFEVIVGISVFTHLDEALQYAWLEELQRILAPNGVAILSVHGDSVWESYPDLTEKMNRSGFHFLKNYIGMWNFAGLPDFYQVTFHSKAYIERNWSKYFDIVHYADGAIGNHQTVVVLRKRESLDTSQ